MEVRITCRQCKVPDRIKTRVTEKVERLTRYEPRLSGAEVFFWEDGRERVAEAVLSVHGSDQVFAKASEDEFGRAVDRMADRLAVLLRKGREQRTDHRGGEGPVDG